MDGVTTRNNYAVYCDNAVASSMCVTLKNYVDDEKAHLSQSLPGERLTWFVVYATHAQASLCKLETGFALELLEEVQ